MSAAPRLRIGVNALYLIPGGVGGTEIYLRSLLPAMAEIDPESRYFVFLNRETAADLAPAGWTAVPLDVRAVNRPARILCEQTELPLSDLEESLPQLLQAGGTEHLYVKADSASSVGIMVKVFQTAQDAGVPASLLLEPVARRRR